MARFAWFASLRARLLILVALAVLPALVVTFSTAARWRQHETADARADALRLARHVSTLHARMIDDSRGGLFPLAQLAGTFLDNDEHLRRLLETCLREHKGYETLTLFRPDGSVAQRVGKPLAEESAGGRPYVKRAIDTGRFAVGSYDVDWGTARASLTFAYPVVAGHDPEVRCVLTATVGMSWLTELPTQALLPRGTTVSVFDDRGTVIGKPKAGDRSRANAVPRAVLRAATAPGNGEVVGEVTTADGIARQYAVEPLPSGVQGGRLYVMVGIPTDVATEGADRILLRNLALVGLALLVAGTVSWVGSDLFFMRHTRALVAATVRLRTDLTARTGIARGPGELHQLARAFDEMASVLQQRAEQIISQRDALNRQSRRFRALIERSSDGIFLVDESGTLGYVSPSTARILGYAPADLLGGDSFGLVHPDDRDFAQSRLLAALARPAQHVTAAVRMRSGDGRWRWIESTLTNLLGEPSVEAVIVNYRDVTDSREAAESLVRANVDLELRVEERTADLSRSNAALAAEVAERRRAEEALRKYSRAIEQTDDSVFITNRDGVIEYVNSALVRLTGYNANEAVGATPRLFTSGHHDAGFYRSLWQALLAGRVFRSVFLNKGKDGRLYYEDQTITPMQDEAGQVTHFVSTGRDITRQKRSEEALRRLNEKLEQEAARIAAALHDESSQFLTAAHITLAEVGRDLPPAARCRLDMVRGHLDQIEEQLRRLSHELRPRILDDLGLEQAVRFVADGVSRRKGIAISVSASLSRRYPPLVETAVYRMVQEALTNMTRHSGASHGAIVLREEAGSLYCSVRDDGRGFDAAGALSPNGGSSLGLKGIQDRLEAVSAVFEIVSTSGGGTELRARIPLENGDGFARPARG